MQTQCAHSSAAHPRFLRHRFVSAQTLRLADFMMKKTMGFSADSDASSVAWTPVPVTPPRPLDLALSSASLRAIATAEVAFDKLVHEHEV